MKKTLAVAGTVVALVVVPGMASAAEAVTVPASLIMQSNCAADGDGGTKPVDEDNAEESDGTGEGGTEGGGTEGGGTEGGGTEGGGTEGGGTEGGGTEGGGTDGTGAGEAGASDDTDGFSSGRSSFGQARQQAQEDCSEALEPGSNYSDEDGDGEPEVKDQADDDGDGQVDEVDTASQVSVVPDGGAETGDGSTGGVIGMTSAGAAVLALFTGFGLWVRRALART